MKKIYIQPNIEALQVNIVSTILAGSGGAQGNIGDGGGEDDRTDQDITGGNGDALAPGFNGLIDDEED